MNRTYELMFIVRPDMTEEDQDKLISNLESAVTSSGGGGSDNVTGVPTAGARIASALHARSASAAGT